MNDVNYWEWCRQRRRLKRQEDRDESDLDDRLADGFEMLDDDDHDDPLTPLLSEEEPA